MRTCEHREISMLMKSVLFSLLSKSNPQAYSKMQNRHWFLRDLIGGLQCSLENFKRRLWNLGNPQEGDIQEEWHPEMMIGADLRCLYGMPLTNYPMSPCPSLNRWTTQPLTARSGYPGTHWRGSQLIRRSLVTNVGSTWKPSRKNWVHTH